RVAVFKSEPSIVPRKTTMMAVMPVAINNSANVNPPSLKAMARRERKVERSRGMGRINPTFLFGRIIIGSILGNDPHIIAVSLIRRGRWALIRHERPEHTNRYLVSTRRIGEARY